MQRLYDILISYLLHFLKCIKLFFNDDVDQIYWYRFDYIEWYVTNMTL